MVNAFAEPPACRVAIVTGGSRGIGAATVRKLATHGYAVVVNYAHDQRAAEATVDTILDRNGTAVAIRADVTDDLDVERLFAETIAMFSGIDAVVHAVRRQAVAPPLAAVGLEEIDATWREGARPNFIVNREAGQRVRSGGAIVNLSSALVGWPFRTDDFYPAATATVATLTAVLARQLGTRDITVNAVSPAADEPCAPGRVADVIAYLLSVQGHAITGQVIDVDK